MSARILQLRPQPRRSTGTWEKKSAIVWAAIDALAEADAAISIDEIANRAGVEVSEITRLFGGEGEVFSAAMRELATWADA